MKINITKNGRQELDRLGFEIETSLDTILAFIPKSDSKGISEIIVTDFPNHQEGSKKHKSLAAYVKQSSNKPAHIVIYLKNLFAHIGSGESFNLMLPIQEFGLSKVIFHELGHHVRITKSHGVPKIKSEKFADCYSEKIMKNYLIYSAPKIDKCFKILGALAKKGKMSVATVENMKTGWEEYRKELRQ